MSAAWSRGKRVPLLEATTGGLSAQLPMGLYTPRTDGGRSRSPARLGIAGSMLGGTVAGMVGQRGSINPHGPSQADAAGPAEPLRQAG